MSSSVKRRALPKTQENEMTRYLSEARHFFLRVSTVSILCVISYSLITHMLAHMFSVSEMMICSEACGPWSLLFLYIATATSKVCALPYRV